MMLFMKIMMMKIMKINCSSQSYYCSQLQPGGDDDDDDGDSGDDDDDNANIVDDYGDGDSFRTKLLSAAVRK